MNFRPPTDKQARVLWFSLTAFAVALLVAILALAIWGLGWVLKLLSPVLWPLAIAGVIAYLLDPVVGFLEQKRVSRPRAILVVFSVGLLLIGGFFASVVPQLIRETTDLVASVPAYSRVIQKKVSEWASASSRWGKIFSTPPASVGDMTTNQSSNAVEPGTAATNTASTSTAPAVKEPAWENKLTESTVSWLTAMLPKLGSWMVGQVQHMVSWVGFVIGFVMVPVFTFYFLKEKRGIQESWTHYLPVQESSFKEELVFVLNSINDYLIVFFRGQVLIALCNAVLLTIGFVSMGLNYGVLFGVAAGVFGIVPYLGTIITIVPAMIVAAVEYKDWLHPLLVVGVYSLVHLIEGFILSPKIMGDRVGLHPLTIIVAVLVGTTLLGGILGGVLAIPLTAALRVVMFRYVWKKRTAEP